MKRRIAPADLHAVAATNRLRGASPCARLARLEALAATRFGSDRRLAVYGSLAPGRANCGQLAPLRGDWHSGLNVRGRLRRGAHGSAAGYPLLHCSPSGPPVPVELFVSDDLPAHWARLDAFEGECYVRLLVPVRRNHVVVAVANVYAASAIGIVRGERATET